MPLIEFNASPDSAIASRTNAVAGPLSVSPSAVTMRQRFAGAAPPGADDFRWKLTSDQWIRDNKTLQLHVGPNEASWTMPLRASFADTIAGKARYAQPRISDFGSTFYEIATVQLSFQSGNVMPIYDSQGGVAAPIAISDGLSDFHYFRELVGQSPRIGSGDVAANGVRGRTNYTYLFYTSPKFPSITLTGFFGEDGISWSETVEDYNSQPWSATFHVIAATPSLDVASQQISAFTSALRVR